MRGTESASNEKSPLPENKQGASTQPLALEAPSQKQVEGKSQSPSLSVSVSQHLLKLMQEVTANEINPKTVNAACNCATAIHKFITLNLRLKPQQ